MNAYTIYNVADTFENDNGESYIILGLSEDRDKALLITMSKPSRYIGAKGLREHHWCHGHYFMEDLTSALEWFAKDDSVPEKKPDKKYLFKFDYTLTHIPNIFSDDNDTMCIMAYSLDDAVKHLHEAYNNTDWAIVKYDWESLPYVVVDEEEDN